MSVGSGGPEGNPLEVCPKGSLKVCFIDLKEMKPDEMTPVLLYQKEFPVETMLVIPCSQPYRTKYGIFIFPYILSPIETRRGFIEFYCKRKVPSTNKAAS